VLRSAYAPPILDADHETVAGLMTRAGYDAAAFGKWHLGMRWSNRAGNGVPAIGLGMFSTPDVDFSKPFADGPLQHGFRYFFGLASSINHDPYTFIENDRVTDLPTVRRPQKSVGNGAFREGWVADSWDDSQQGAVISGVALDWITRHVATSPRVPFFLYYAATANHVPHVPPAALRGQRVAGRGGADDGMPARNDMVVENDVILGLLLDRLEDPNGDGDRSDSIAGETLVMATSDNGADFGRYAGIRGRKGSIYEGGHRIPLLARWPGRIPAGAVTDQLISLVDLYATLAALTGTHPADGAAEDSENMLPAFVAAPCDRGPMLQQESGLANVFAVRDGDWKLIIRGDKAVELYDLGADRGERRNLVSVEPTVAARLLGHYRRIRGRDDRG
jgi:arylsulfatase A-like enzyme